MEQMDDKETTSSRLKILDAIEYEIPSASKLERPTFRCGEQDMPVHVKLYDSKDGQAGPVRARCDAVPGHSR